MEDELEQIRKKRLSKIQDQEIIQGPDEEAVVKAQQEEYEAQRQMVLRRILTQEARQRLTNLKMARPDVVRNLEDQLISLASTGRIGVVDDHILKQLLRKIMPKKRDIKIERR